jgi:heterotetrameric sarcosine oxidase gamma subunit
VSRSSSAALIAKSPIPAAEPVAVRAGWEVSERRSSADLTITDCTPVAKVSVRAPVGGEMSRALDVRAGQRGTLGARTARDAGGSLVVGAGPGEWLVLAAPGAAREVATQLVGLAITARELVSVIDLTHGRALVRITGARTGDLLAKLSAVDFSRDATPDASALRTSVARVATDVIRDDVVGGRRGSGATMSYLLHCERSSGRYLFDALVEAGAAFGIEVEGFVDGFVDGFVTRVDGGPGPAIAVANRAGRP